MDWGAMATGLTLPPDDPAHCDIAPASIPVTTTDLANAVRFSVPTFRSGYAVAVGVLKQTSDAWGFTKVFNWQVWLALLISGMGISLLVWCAERDFTRRGMGKVKYPAGFRPGMYEATYRTYGKLLNTVDEPRVTSLPGKLMALGWGLVVLVTISTYTAGLTARLTAVNIQTKISGIADLPGRKVGTWDAIAKNFMKYGIRPEPLPWDTEADGLRMLDMVASGGLDALILDSPWLRYQLADRCDVTIVGRMFQRDAGAVDFATTPGTGYRPAKSRCLQYKGGFLAGTAGYLGWGHPRKRDSAPGGTADSGIRRRGAPQAAGFGAGGHPTQRDLTPEGILGSGILQMLAPGEAG